MLQRMCFVCIFLTIYVYNMTVIQVNLHDIDARYDLLRDLHVSIYYTRIIISVFSWTNIFQYIKGMYFGADYEWSISEKLITMISIDESQ